MRHTFLLVHFLREYSFDLKGKIRSSLGDVARLREKKFGKKKTHSNNHNYSRVFYAFIHFQQFRCNN